MAKKVKQKKKVEKDVRFEAVKALIENERIKTFNQIIPHFAKTPLADAIGMNKQTFTARLEDPSSFVIAELEMLAYKFDVDIRVMINLVINELDLKK